MCRNEAGRPAASARASSLLTTSYGGAMTSAARSGRGRSARNGLTRLGIARLYGGARLLLRSAPRDGVEHALDRVDHDLRLVELDHVVAVVRDDELAVRRQRGETLLSRTPILFERRHRAWERLAVRDHDEREVAELP